MLPTETSNLPPKLRAHLHPVFLANERDYLRLRDSLLPAYGGRWVAVHAGRVVAVGDDLLAVLDAGAAVHPQAYFARVGEEDRVVFRNRLQVFAYDLGYRPFPLPRAAVTFLNHAETASQVFPDVIPDTGADTCVLPETDCLAFDRFNSPGFPGLAAGFAGAATSALFYHGKAEVNGTRVTALIQAVADGDERLLGRNVLNHHRVVFDGPQRRVVVEP